DECFDEMKLALVTELREDREDGESFIDLIMIAKYFERIGDHATNIAEWVIFSVTGVHKEEDL
ncbi:MAG: phosphate transport system regulatory protein PhoU, partial [Clostridiales bacterium]|nr:phosphate transport system regulatory protein PhoU [Clostridiales bacterium]